MIFKCSNGSTLIITEKKLFESELGNHLIPYITLLTAWNIDDISLDYWRDLIRLLIDKGCKYFICVGTYSENLHDTIDELLYEYDDILETDQIKKIVTTFHDNESLEDILNYFISATPIPDKKHNCLTAILDNNSPKDQELRMLLKRNFASS